jgi:hypothetical protein
MLLVIVNDLHVRRSGRSVNPFKANPPLVVDADAVLALTVAVQYLESVPRQSREITSDVAASTRSSFRRAGRSNPENAFTRLPAAKSLVRLPRKLTITYHLENITQLRVTSSVKPDRAGQNRTADGWE